MNIFVLFLTLTFFIVCKADDKFVIPIAFQGLWSEFIEYSSLGPGNPYVFSISEAPNGDYLFENNLIYDSAAVGYQRFYVEGTGSTSGSLWYCGALSNFSDNVEETGGSFRVNLLIPQQFPSANDTVLIFCLDSDDPNVMNGGQNPFKFGCQTCDCLSWTLTYNPESDQLTSHLVMAGVDDGSTHLLVTMDRTGDAPVVTNEQMAPHGSEFSCEFEDGGRDSEAIDRDGSGRDNTRKIFVKQDTTVKVSTSKCPFQHKITVKSDINIRNELNIDKSKTNEKRSLTGETSHDYCYNLNNASDFELQWTLEGELLHISMSTTLKPDINTENSDSDYIYIALGFRPLSRSGDGSLVPKNTGHHMNFGMQGKV